MSQSPASEELNRCQGPVVPFAPGATLWDLVAAQAERSPDALAVVRGEDSLSYRQLVQQAERVAAALQQRGVGLEKRVAIYLHRRPALLVALLGVLRAGGAYLPLDPAYPSERTSAILGDAQPLLLITENALLAAAPPVAGEVLLIDELAAAPGPVRLEGGADADAAAYLIYTSGSTGKPKGVVLPHRCAVNLIRWAADHFSAAELAVMLFATSINFDLSVWEMFLPLAVGGKIVVAHNALELPELPERDTITFLDTVPSAVAELLRLGPLPESLRVIALAGEALRRELAAQVLAAAPAARLYNFYAPSETTTYSTFLEVLPGDEEPTIGRPLANTRCFVLDQELRPVGPGELGELYLGGAGITRGYLRQPALTAAAFLPDPFANLPGFRPGDRLYRTGDLVRLQPNGELAFFGRRDHQVKIRGFRIELGEIEKTAERQPGVRRAALTARRGETGELELVAHLEAAAAELPAAALVAEVQAALAQQLPSYMVPGRFEVLTALPQLPNGKIDRKTLAARPLPPRHRAPAATPAAAPVPTEAELEAALGELLGGTLPPAQLASWIKKLTGAPLELPTDRPRPAQPSWRSGRLERRLEPGWVAACEAAGERHGASPFFSFLAPFMALLARLSGQPQVNVGVPFAGCRPDEPGEPGGASVQSLVFSADFASDPDFATLLGQLREDFARVFAHRQVPFEKLVAAAGIPHEASRHPVFQAAFELLENGGRMLDFGPGPAADRLAAASARPGQLDFALVLARQADGGLVVAAHFASELFDQATAARWLDLYLQLLGEIQRAPQKPLGALPLQLPADRALLAAVNATTTDFPRDSQLIREFALAAAKWPELVAAEFEGQLLSYRELDLRSGRLAAGLAEAGALPGAMVGVCLPRGLELVVALLAIVKTGAAYVPLDADYPPERLAAMIEDTRMPLLLTSAALAAQLPHLSLRKLLLEELEAATAGAQPLTAQLAWPESAAYVIFTSGSTGRPKGVVIPHRGILRLVKETRLFDLKPGEVVAQISTASFDAYTIEIWGALLNGGRLLVIDRDTQLDSRAFAAAIDRPIALLPLNASYFSRLVVEQPDSFKKARYLFFGGEASEPGIVRRSLPGKPQHLKNTYGPTECTMLATAYEVNGLAEDARSVPIGKPISNTEIRIEGRDGREVPLGAHGELLIGGPGLAWGYWRRPALTAQAFVPHPAPRTPGERLYRSGDLVRMLPSGDLEYLGRLDSQVKVRGFRIELGEIEATLGRHPEVGEKIALTRGQGADQALLAAVVVAQDAEGNPRVSAAELQRFCASSLPAFAVPRIFLVDAMPMTPTGKIDRQALLARSREPGLDEAAPQEAPAGALETLVARAFGDLLGLASPGRAADFFALGGHSLQATRLLARLREETGVALPVSLFFRSPTVAALAAAIAARRLAAGEPAAAAPPLPKASGSEQLSFAEQRLYFLYRFDPDSPVYNLPAAFRLRGALDCEALRQALSTITTRQAILRTAYREKNGVPVAEVLPPEPLQLPLEPLPPEAAAARLRQLAAQSFDLRAGKPWRCALFELAAHDYLLFVGVHHIAFDGLSQALFEKELAAAYRAAASGKSPELPPLPLTYRDFAAWQRQLVDEAELQRQLAFWKPRLTVAPLELPTDRPRPALPSFRGNRLERRLEPGWVAAFEALGRRHGATPFLSFLAPFMALLARLSGQPRVNVGVPFSGRHHGEVDPLFGFFVNTLVLAADFSADPDFATLLGHLREEFARVFAHQDVPFEKLVEAAELPRDASRNPVFQVAFQLFEKDHQGLDFGPGLAVESVPAPLEVAKLDFDLVLERQADGGLVAAADFATELFDEATVARWLDLYLQLLGDLLRAPQQPLGALPLQLPADRALLAAVNATTTDFPRDSQLIREFALAAAKWPELVAAEFEGQLLSYRELDLRSGRLAAGLAEAGALPGAMVGVCLQRGLELVVALLAIVKTGAAYVPLDADYPPERLAAMIEDTRMPLLLTSAALAAQLPHLSLRQLLLDELEAATATAQPLTAQLAWPESAAYVIFTSGSTGRPKGVVIPHRGILRLVKETRLFELEPGEVVAQISTASFDAYTIEIWGALLNGGRLLVIDRDTQLDTRAFAAAIDRPIALLPLNASYFSRLVVEQPDSFKKARYLFFGGEASEPGIVRRSLPGKPQHLKNTYGPTECTMLATAYEVVDLAEDARSVPIGKPISNTEIRIEGRDGREVPLGAHGELLIGGPGLAWGYWRRPALTARAFVPHPAPRTPGERLYRSGDLVRMLPSGDLEYLGRLDSQVKVRGFRIELGEIEATLGRHPEVGEKIALTRGQGADQALLAAVVVAKDAEGNPRVSAAELQRFCASSLPAFAVPRIFLVDAMPMTPTGKIDRQALLARSREPGLLEAAPQEAPAGALETLLARAFGEVLELPAADREALGRGADFFALGGHSLLAIRLIAKIAELGEGLLGGVEVPVKLIFTAPTVAGLAAAIAALAPTSSSWLDWRPSGSEKRQLSFAQQRLYFLHRFDPGSPLYNIPTGISLVGPLDRAALASALATLETRQDILRTRLVEEDGVARPELLPAGPVVLPVEKIEREQLPARLDQLTREGFDLLREKPWRIRLFELGEQQHLLFVLIHHIAADGLSLAIFGRELGAAYRAARRGESPRLPELRWSYADFAEWQRQWLAGEELERQLAFWRERLTHEPLELPTDRPRPPLPSFRGDRLELRLPASLVRQLEELGRRHGATPFLCLLAPFLMLLARLSGQRQVQVGVPFAGRHRGEAENLIGFFVNTLVLAADCGDDPAYETLLPRLRDDFAQVFAHQDVPFEKLVEALEVSRDPSRNPLFQVAFQLFENDHAALDFGELAATPELLELRVAKVDFDLVLERQPDGGLAATASYAVDLFEEATVARFLGLYQLLLTEIVRAPGRRLSTFDLQLPADRALLAAVNATTTDFPRDSQLIREFALAAAKWPELVAAEFKGEVLSYRELDLRSGRLAAGLAEAGAIPGAMVGVCLPRGLELVVALLAIVKTGAAYVPLDADYPPERLATMIEDTRMPLLLTSAALAAQLPALALRQLLLDELEAATATAQPLTAQLAWPESAAYVIFTSGSTGRPKGVVIPHRGILRLVKETRLFELEPGEVVAQISTASFDAYTIEIWGALLNGGRLLVIDRDTQLDTRAFAAAIDRPIALLPLNASYFSRLVVEQPDSFKKARYLFFGGEASEPGIVRRSLPGKPQHLKNTYGPTECTMLATAYEVVDLAEDARSVPIGKPISNTEIRIEGRDGREVPLGAHGELLIGGPGLAWGYWRRPALTAQAFVPHPAPRTPGERLYRSGDLVRMLPSGDLEYLGRLDSQVKVRGFRIELGEIEATLGRHPEVGEKIALTRGQGADQALLAAVVVAQDAEGNPRVSAAELQRFCASSLPAFAVPRIFLVDAMPMTPTGKIDRQALLARSREVGLAEAAPQEAPAGALETLLARAFGEVLELPAADREALGRGADFFALGGHSLLAIRLIAKIAELGEGLLGGVEVPVRLIFTAPTVAGLAAAIEALAETPLAAPPGHRLAGSQQREAPRLSFAQQRLFFLHRFDPATAVYNMPAAYRLRGQLDPAALRVALETLEQRQEILRTRLREEAGVGYPELLPAAGIELPHETITAAALPARLRELGREPFDLFAEKPWRPRLLELAADDHVLFIGLHHIAGDGLSLTIFEKELAAAYRAALAGVKPELPELPWSYADFAEWQREWLAGDELERQLAFWRERVPAEPLELPTDRPRPPLPSYRGDQVERYLPASLVRELENLGRGHGATPFLTFLTPFLMLLARLSGQRQVAVGVPFSGRHRGQVDHLIGFFVNTLMLTADCGDDPSFATLLPRLREDFGRVYAHQDVPFEKLVEALEVGRDPSRNPLFQVTFQLFEKESVALDFGGLELVTLPFALGVAKLDLDLALERQADGGLRIGAEYATDLFTAATVAGWLELYEILLRALVATPAARLSQLPLLRPADRAAYEAVNATASPFPRDASLAELFAQRVAAGPELVAAEYQGRELTYRELDLASHRLACLLREHGVAPMAMVGLCFDRGLELVVAILAVVKAGAAYVPLDPDYPEARLRAMIEDTAISVVLGSAAQLARLPRLGFAALAYESLAGELARPELASRPLPPVAGGLTPAVVIFTSGSTGRPKGVVVPTRAICRLLFGTHYVELRPGDVLPQVSTASFDAYTFEIWGALLHGGRLLVIDRDTLLDPRAFAAALAEREVAALFLTVTLFTQMVLAEPRAFARVRHLLFGGEACDPGIVRRARDNPPAHLQNVYGPTECTTFATSYEVRELAASATSVPIGKPIANTEALVLDRFGQLAPLGVFGELCLAGDGLALGYWRRPAITARAFVPHPCSDTPGARLYRTGDLARLLPSGDFEFLGRLDFQVKVRGYRIELGEVEAVLGRHPAVREKIVLTQGQGRDQQLVAFVVVQKDAAGMPEASAAELQKFAAATLPAFAVPRIQLLAAMPLGPSGKIDRQALPLLRGASESEDGSRRPPTTPTEIAVAAAFEALLDTTGVDLDADFFALGGHSLMAIRLIADLRQRLGIELPVRQLFATPTVGALAAAAAAAVSPRRWQRPAGARSELSFAQQRLFFLHRFDPGSPVYNIPSAFRLRGPLDLPALVQALEELEQRQEILRTRFREEDGLGWPEVLPPGQLELPREKVAPADLPRRLRELAEQSFDLLNEKPWRLALLELGGQGEQGEAVLFVNVHHIAFDGLSLVLFEKELAALYRAALGREKAELPPLPWSYQDYAVWQRDWLQGAELENQLAFWRERLNPEPLELPTDKGRPKVSSFRGEVAERRLDPELVEQLERYGRDHGATAFLTFLAPFLMLLSRLSGQPRVAVGVPFSGRHSGEVDNLIGFFINTLVVGAEFSPRSSFATALPRLREDFAALYAHQDVPFEKLVEELQIGRDASRNPLFQVAFQLFEADQETPDFGGLLVEALPIELRGAKLDLDLILQRLPGGALLVSAFFATDLFTAATVAGWLELYEILLRAVVAAPERRLQEIPLLRPADRALYAALNHNTTSFPREASLASLFARQAAAFPDQIAAEYRGRTLDYRELDLTTNRLANLLRRRGAVPGSMVGLCFERGLELAMAILAVVKTGAAYVPLDGDYPEARLRGMVEDTAMPILLGSAAQVARLPQLGLPLLALEELAPELATTPATALPPVPGGLAPAVVIFTSGSTGKPKGVVVTQRAICRLVFATNYIEFQPGDVVAQVSTASFDVYTFEIWGAFLHGGRLLVLDRETLLDPRAFVAAIADREIAAMFLTVALFTQIMLEAPQAFTRVRHLMFGGEACEPSIVRRALPYRPAHLQNGYGPAECTTYATTCDVFELAEDAGSVPIGKPISNTEVWVLDRAGQPASVGVHGELCLAGDGLALGYWRRPALTAAAFVPHPVSAEPGQRLYRTGDLARLLPSGDFDYLGRIDFQVKVRGYRIELGEVEAVLGRHPAVREKIAMTRGKGRDQILVAFVVAPSVSAQDLQRHCAEQLPAFSVPLICLLEQMPFTPNGKIDRKALENQPLFGSEPVGEAARGPLEQRLAQLWGEVLAIPAPSRDADFFSLGGHSLLAARLISRLREELGRELPLRAIFEAPTIAQLAALLAPLAAAPASGGPAPLARLPRPQGVPEPAPLSSGQAQLYFLQSLDPAAATFNMPLLFRVPGELDAAAFAAAAADLLARHEVLRTSFQLAAGKPRQIVHPAGQLDFEAVDLRDQGEGAFAAALHLAQQEGARPFALERLPLLRFRLYLLGGETLVLIHLHHLIGDGRSFEILLAELDQAYLAHRGGDAPQWPELPLQYADFAAWQQAWLASEEARAALDRRCRQLAGGSFATELPTDHARRERAARRGQSISRLLPAGLAEAARHFAPEGGTSLYMTLLAAYSTWLTRASGREDLYIGTPIAARPRPELEQQLGYYVNTAVLRIDSSGDPSFAELLGRARAATLDAFEATDLPYATLVAELAGSGKGLFDVFFSLGHGAAGESFAGQPRRQVELHNGTSQFDLTLFVADDGPGGRLELFAEFDADLFETATVEAALADYEALLARALGDPRQRLSSLLAAPRWPARTAAAPSAGPAAPAPAAAKAEENKVSEAKKSLSASQQDLLAARLAKAKAAKAGQTPAAARPAGRFVLPIEAQGAAPPLFCVHPAGGDVLCFEPLARHLGRPLYGIQSRGLVEGFAPDADIPAMATAYLEAIEKIAGGRYLLAGWSLGGMIAYEMACQLEQRGQRPELVAIFDSLPQLPPRPELDEAAFADDTRWLLDIAEYSRGFWGKSLELDENALRAAGAEERLELFLAAAREKGLLPSGTRSLDLRRLLDVFKANTRAAYTFAARPYSGRLELFVAEENSQEFAALGPSLGWENFAAAVAVHRIPAHHVNLIAEPHVGQVAAILRQRIAEL